MKTVFATLDIITRFALWKSNLLKDFLYSDIIMKNTWWLQFHHEPSAAKDRKNESIRIVADSKTGNAIFR